MEWQPIETAPEGAPVLLRDNWHCMVVGHQFLDHWYPDGVAASHGPIKPVIDIGYPTHWMPLPPPPDKVPE